MTKDNSYKNFTPLSLAGYFDHTQLKAAALRADFEKLCREAAEYHFKMVAINPAPVAFCKKLLAGSGVHVGAAVGFPLGQNTREIKLAEALAAMDQGADEIDYVVNITELKEKNYPYVEKEMALIVEACRKRGCTSKVIFENCYLNDEEKKELCRISLSVLPDFIKTSTGFGSGGAVLEDLRLMKSQVGDKIKIKAAGGIRDLDTALAMIDAGAERIGSSAGLAIVEELKRSLQ
jgi:deoxyribose-phosphate aldolase